MKVCEICVREANNGVRNFTVYAENLHEAETRIQKAYDNSYLPIYNYIVNFIPSEHGEFHVLSNCDFYHTYKREQLKRIFAELVTLDYQKDIVAKRLIARAEVARNLAILDAQEKAV